MTDTRRAREAAWTLVGKHLKTGASQLRGMTVVPGGIDRIGDAGVVDRPVCTYWYGGEVEKGETLGNMMVEVTVHVMVFWRMAATERDAEAQELALWHATRELQAPFAGDRTLDGNVTAIFIENAEQGQIEMMVGTVEMTARTLSFDIRLQELEAEAVAA